MIALEPYEPRWFAAWRQLSLDWLEEYGLLEPADFHLLDHPQEWALDRGGAIWLALDGGRPVGTVSLLPTEEDGCWELAKLSVAPAFRRRGVGRLLAQAALDSARARGARRVVLFTNSRLLPALALYRSMGFAEVTHCGSAYCESDRRFELRLEEADHEGDL